MKLAKMTLLAAGGFLSMALVGFLTAPKLAAALRATFVEVVIPSRPFYARLTPSTLEASAGPDTGTLAITNITVTNSGANLAFVAIFDPSFSGPGGCVRPDVDKGPRESPVIQIVVQPYSTQAIAYPTPLVFAGVSGHTCVAAAGDGGQVFLTGFVN